MVTLTSAESPVTGPAGVVGSGGTGAAGSFGSGGTYGGTTEEAREVAGGSAGRTLPRDYVWDASPDAMEMTLQLRAKEMRRVEREREQEETATDAAAPGDAR